MYEALAMPKNGDEEMTESTNELQKIMDEDFSERKKVSPQKWAGFVESSVVNFFDEHKIEKLAVKTVTATRRSLFGRKTTE